MASSFKTLAEDGTDIHRGDWVDRLLPPGAQPYARLMRLDRPIGTWLLLFPCWWSLAMAWERWRDLALFAAFGLGAVIMRGAGCTWNDITDREFDAKVARTRTRPLPSGQVSLRAAFAFLAAQLLAAFLILASFNRFAIALGAASLVVVFAYPLMKRITYWPQIVLGLAFNWGALMGWAAAFGRLDGPALLLYGGSISWVIGYDTIYAHQDREDDALIGIKSTALLFGERSTPMLALFFGIAVVLIGAAGFAAGGRFIFALGLVAFAAHLSWQIASLDISDPDNCLKLFKSDRDAGLILFAGLVLDATFRHLA